MGSSCTKNTEVAQRPVETPVSSPQGPPPHTMRANPIQPSTEMTDSPDSVDVTSASDSTLRVSQTSTHGQAGMSLPLFQLIQSARKAVPLASLPGVPEHQNEVLDASASASASASLSRGRTCQPPFNSAELLKALQLDRSQGSLFNLIEQELVSDYTDHDIASPNIACFNPMIPSREFSSGSSKGSLGTDLSRRSAGYECDERNSALSNRPATFLEEDFILADVGVMSPKRRKALSTQIEQWRDEMAGIEELPVLSPASCDSRTLTFDVVSLQ